MKNKSKGPTAIRKIGVLVIVLTCVLTASCKPKPPPLPAVYTPQELHDLLIKADGWVPLVIPDSKYQAGSIIQVAASDGQPQWIDHLDACIRKDDFDNFLTVGVIPGLKFEKNAEFDAKLLLNFRGVRAGPKFKNIKKVILSLDDNSAVAFRVIKFGNWYKDLEDTDYITKIDPCLNALEEPNMFLVREAFVLNKASYLLISNTDSAIELSLPSLSDFLETETNVGYSVSSKGLLTVEQPVVVAVRQAVNLGDVFSSPALLPDGPPIDDPTANIRTADDALDQWYLRSIQE